MCKKLIYLVCFVLVLGMVSSAYASNIIWVSDATDWSGDGALDDRGWVDLLRAEGYSVDYKGEGGSEAPDYRYWRGTLDDAKIAELNAADLVIVSRDTSSGSYNAPTQWNSVTTPLILQSVYLARNNRWKWFETDSLEEFGGAPTLEAVDPGHPIFYSVPLSPSNQVDILDGTVGGAIGHTSFIQATDAGNGTMIAKRADNDWAFITEWEPEVEFYAGAGQTAGGRRMLFTSGNDNNQDPVPTVAMYNLTAEGEKVFLNAVRYMLGALKRVNAYNPVPADGALQADTWANLSWRAGGFAASHDVYFGENFDDVNDGAESTFLGNQAVTSLIVGFPGLPYPEGLVPGTTYYWRIDEVNDTEPNSPWKGNVWNFMIPPQKAYNPIPVDGAQFEAPNVELSWTPGLKAILHTVYFGDNFDDVNSAAGGLQQADTTYTPGTLELDKVYYWRVDEFDSAATYKGDVWSFKTLPEIPITDPNLVGWWTFDEGIGSNALDWSGHGHDGKLIGDPQWVDGYDGGALEFDGADDYVNLPYATHPTAYTIAAWVKPARTSAASIVLRTSGQGPTIHVSHQLTINSSGVFEHFTHFDSPASSHYLAGTTAIEADSWYFVVAVATNNGDMRLYVNGREEGTAITDIDGTLWAGGDRFLVGSNSSHGMGWFEGIIDDLHIYDYALSQEEIEQVMRGDPLLAWDPNPANWSTMNIDDVTAVSWSPGDNAAQHDVYFGIDKDTVSSADATDTTGVYRGRQDATSYTPVEGIEWGQSYYWRIDESNTDGTISKGRIWSFTISDYLTVDDFESYNDLNPDEPGSNRIFLTWTDGYDIPTNGSIVGYDVAPFCEQSIVHSGSQSLPLFYDTDFKYAEATLTLSSVRDWSKHGVEVLSLWFQGRPTSDGSFVEVSVGTYTMTGSGVDISGSSDQFHYAFKTLNGPGSIIAKVESLENTNNWAKAGVMIRETLDADSVYAAIVVTPGQGVVFQHRTITGEASTTKTISDVTAPQWVKIERDATSSFTVSYSADGFTWVAAGVPMNIPMGAKVYIGLALTSHNTSKVCEAKFSNVSTTGTVGGQWRNQDVGIASNAAELMYVTLNDSATVYHDNPEAALMEEWTQWTIDLQEFAAQGVNLTNVNTIAIGFGDKSNLRAGGSGVVLFDDIRLYRPTEPEPQP